MVKTLRRLFWLAMLGGAGYVGWTAWQRHAVDDPAPPPEWPPVKPPPTAPQARTTDDARPADVAGFADLGSDSPTEEPADETPPDSSPGTSPGTTAEDTTAAEPATAATWVVPVDGRCPDGYPIKANDNSGIFHVPGGRFYDRTVPERCYADAADAEADGYRRAKA